jgi:hypothetical protein
MLGLPGVTTMDVRVGGAAGVPDIPPPPPPPHPASAAVSKIIIAAVPNTFFMLCCAFLIPLCGYRLAAVELWKYDAYCVKV